MIGVDDPWRNPRYIRRLILYIDVPFLKVDGHVEPEHRTDHADSRAELVTSATADPVKLGSAEAGGHGSQQEIFELP
jgi:hypothetical protein